MDASFTGKKITIMGLGLLGRGAGDARFLAEQGAEVTVTDLKSEAELAEPLKELQQFPNITFHLGGHQMDDFHTKDLILKAPKTPKDSMFVVEARRHGIPVSMSTALFARYAKEAGATIVGITGTRGKTTTTEMIAHILRTAGKTVLVGGNIRGVSTLALLPQVTKDTIAVLELDSWQLQGFGEERLSPDVAVFTTFYPDHMDYYGNDMDAYLADKAEIFQHQTEGNTLVFGKQAKEAISGKYVPPILPVTADPKEVTAQLKIPGMHAVENAACALAAVRALGVSDADALSALASFEGVPGRLECIGEKDGVKFYNDTTATTPEATIAALRALSEGGKRVILIMGGADKGLSMQALVEELPRRAKRVILLPGTGTDLLIPFLEGVSVYGDMRSAVEEAVKSAASGESVLLSPAFASFGLFKNEYDRGDQFTEIVQSL